MPPKKKAKANANTSGPAAEDGAPNTIRLTSDQYDQHMNPTQSSTPQYRRMIEWLYSEENFQEGLFFPLVANTYIYNFLESFTISVFLSRKNREHYEQERGRRRFAFVLIIGMLTRLLDHRIYIMPIVLLSLLAVQSRVGTRFWRICTFSRLTYSKPIAEEISRDVGMRVRCTKPEGTSTKIAFAAGDNCAFSIPSDKEHLNPERKRDYYQTIMWWFCFVTNAYDEQLGGTATPATCVQWPTWDAWQWLASHPPKRVKHLPGTGAFDNDGAKALTICELTDFDAQEGHKHSMWVYFFAIALEDSVATDIIQHPDYDPG